MTQAPLPTGPYPTDRPLPPLRQQLSFWLPFAASVALAVAALLFNMRRPGLDASGTTMGVHFAAMALVLIVGCGLGVTAVLRAFRPLALWLGIAALVGNAVALVLMFV